MPHSAIKGRNLSCYNDEITLRRWECVQVEHKVVGLMSITGKVDVESLNRNFELDLFDNLVSKVLNNIRAAC